MSVPKAAIQSKMNRGGWELAKKGKWALWPEAGVLVGCSGMDPICGLSPIPAGPYLIQTSNSNLSLVQCCSSFKIDILRGYLRCKANNKLF